MLVPVIIQTLEKTQEVEHSHLVNVPVHKGNTHQKRLEEQSICLLCGLTEGLESLEVARQVNCESNGLKAESTTERQLKSTGQHKANPWMSM